MSNQAVALPAAARRPKSKTCGSCRGPLESNDPVCQRCEADNTEWLSFQAGHFNGFRLREVLALLTTVVTFAMLLVLGWALFVVLGGSVWTEPVGWVLLLVSLPPAGVAFLYRWSERESFRQSRHMPGVNLKTEFERFQRRTLIVLVFSVAAAFGGPLFLFIAPVALQIGNALFGLSLPTALPEITRGTYVLMFLAVWFFYLMRVGGEELGDAVAREYAAAADAVAPPLIFERQEKFYELCKQAVLSELAAVVDPKKVKWLKLERSSDGGMTAQASIPDGDQVVQKLNEFNYERVPREKKYDVRLDRWARLTSIALVTEKV